MTAECEVVVETKAVSNLTVSYRANQAMYDSEVVVETKAVCNLTVSYLANQAMYDSRVRGGGGNKGCEQSDC